MSSTSDPLAPYANKRNFTVTPEPKAARAAKRKQPSFVIQKHWASRLHYDFRLELDGVLLSWAVPKGPSLDPRDKRMAVQVEDHPVAYGGFEGRIPSGNYGAGVVIVWDRGIWQPEGDPQKGLAQGKLAFTLHGEKLRGQWELVRMKGRSEADDKAWLLFKKKDEFARPREAFDVTVAEPDSVISRPPHAAKAGKPAAVEQAAKADESAKAAKAAKPARTALPEQLKPQLATLVKALPAGEWLFEIKFDGYRILTRIDAGKARLITRNGNDWTDRMPALARQVESLGLQSGWLDGEVVVLDENGRTKFNALQNAFDSHHTTELTYFIFDAPYLDGEDLRATPLRERRERLRRMLAAKGSDHVRFSDDFPAGAATLLKTACAMKLEGVIAKRPDSPYVSARSENWLKLKCLQRQEFVIVGFTERSGDDKAHGLGSLLLAVNEKGRLRYAGNVGTGWSAGLNAELRQRLDAIEVDKAAIDAAQAGEALAPGRWSRRRGVGVHWVQPTLVAEVAFTEWTPDGSVRHASFQGLREDKPAAAITRETPKEISVKKPAATAVVADPKVSHGDRVIDAGTGLTKLDLVRYLDSVADWLLPQLQGRAVSLLRAPQGVPGEQFFQKHDEKHSITGARELDPALFPGHAALVELPTREALLGAAQMNVVEFHPWNSKIRTMDKPDRMIFDLDPGDGVAWERLQEAALLVRHFLQELGLQSWLKTSGGKGLHVVVPLAPRLGSDNVKAFSQAVVLHLAKTIPTRFVAKSGPANRVGKIFVDYLRNGFGQTAVAAYSPRARPGLGVAMPVAWERLDELKGAAQWTITNARDYLSVRQADPWADLPGTKQTLTAAIKALGLEPARPA